MALVTYCKTAFTAMNKVWLLLVLAITPLVQAAEDVAIDQIAAVVNDDSVLMSEAQQRMNARQLSLRQAVDELVLERLQLQQAKDKGIPEGDPQTVITALRTQMLKNSVKVSDQEVAELIASQSDTVTKGESYHLQHILLATPAGVSADQANQTRERAEQVRHRLLAGEDFAQLAKTTSDSHAAKQGGDLGWQAAANLPASFIRALALLKTGDISEVIRDDSGFHLLKLLEREGGKRKMAENIRTRHILVSTTTRDETVAKQKIDDLYQQAMQGASFAQLAKAHSDDPGSAAKGGDLGWVTPGKTVPEFEQVMAQTPPNTLSQPFKTSFGWHILQVLARQPVDQTVDSLRDKAGDFLAERKAEEQYQAWLQGLRSKAFIEYRIPSDNNLQLH